MHDKSELVELNNPQDYENKKEDSEGNYMVEGMCIGMVLGMTVGQLVFDNLAIGLSIGLSIGLAVGLSIKKKNNPE